eukprot:scaffold6532_cov116-Isochrysis_galbana.AAC.9
MRTLVAHARDSACLALPHCRRQVPQATPPWSQHRTPHSRGVRNLPSPRLLVHTPRLLTPAGPGCSVPRPRASCKASLRSARSRRWRRRRGRRNRGRPPQRRCAAHSSEPEPQFSYPGKLSAAAWSGQFCSRCTYVYVPGASAAGVRPSRLVQLPTASSPFSPSPPPGAHPPPLDPRSSPLPTRRPGRSWPTRSGTSADGT